MVGESQTTRPVPPAGKQRGRAIAETPVGVRILVYLLR
jgi:hypothetical protein